MVTTKVKTTEGQASNGPRRLRPSLQTTTPYIPTYDFSDLRDAPPVNIAFEYVQHNWFLVPVDPRTEQAVFSDNVNGPTNDMVKIQDWIEHENLSFGIATGQVSGIVVLRCKGDVGLRTAKALLASCESAATLQCSTKNETYFLFRLPEDTLPCRDCIALGCDFLGDGGHFVPRPTSWKPHDATIATLPDKIRSHVIGTETFGLADIAATRDFASLEQATTFEAATVYKKRGWKLSPVKPDGGRYIAPEERCVPELWQERT
jgi:hypothetical protein